ncbi:MAG: hypothetical protein ACI9ZV_000160 [Candidatus Azotimanducaceae bacterium]|jgi:hypothetical protein
MKQVGNISVSAVDVNLPNMQESFTVSAGIGGFGGGALLGGTRGRLGIGMSDVSVFGLKNSCRAHPLHGRCESPNGDRRQRRIKQL